MNMDPLNILTGEVFHIEKLWVFCCYFEKLALLFEYFLSLLQNTVFNPLIFNQFKFLIFPKDHIVNFFR